MENRNIKITANNSKQFEEIEKMLLKLPNEILSQIESAEFGSVGLGCFFANEFDDNQKIFLPNTLSQITYFENSIVEKSYTGIFCGDYFFKLNKALSDKRPTFVFIAEKENKNVD